nr:MAG TPA: hypothetical protein [Bacteriophage sp.]
MNIIDRGNKSLLEALQKGAKKVSESNGIAHSKLIDDGRVEEAVANIPVQGGAYNSIHNPFMSGAQVKKQVSVVDDVVINKSTQIDIKGKLEDKLQKSISTLGETGEYYNAVDALFTLFTIGKLTESLMESIDSKDLKEIKSIINEFKSAIDSF